MSHFGAELPLKNKVEAFFKDKNGKVVIGQFPSVLISLWVVLLVLNLFMHNKNVDDLQAAVLFAWAYLELTQGVNYFRKTLGAVVLVVVIVGFFAR